MTDERKKRMFCIAGYAFEAWEDALNLPKPTRWQAFLTRMGGRWWSLRYRLARLICPELEDWDD